MAILDLEILKFLVSYQVEKAKGDASSYHISSKSVKRLQRYHIKRFSNGSRPPSWIILKLIF